MSSPKHILISQELPSITQSKWARDSQIKPRQASCKAGREMVLGLFQLQNGTDQQVPESLTLRYGKYRSCQCYPLNYETCCPEQSPSSNTVGDELWTYLTITKRNGYVGGINSRTLCLRHEHLQTYTVRFCNTVFGGKLTLYGSTSPFVRSPTISCNWKKSLGTTFPH